MISHSAGSHFILFFPSLCKVLQSDIVPFAYFCFCCSCLRRHIQKNVTKIDVKERTASVFFQNFYGFIDLTFRSLIHVAVQFPQQHLLKSFLFPTVYSCLLSCRLIAHTSMVSFWAVCAVPSISVPVLYCFDYYSFVLQLEIREHDTSSFVLLSHDSFGYWVYFVFPYKFQNYLFQFYEESMGILTGIALNLQTSLGRMVILTLSVLPIHEHGISFHLCVLSSVTFLNVLSFSEYVSFTPYK